MPPHPDEDPDAELCPIPLSSVARARLRRLAEATGERPLALAAIMLDKMLEDDERENRLDDPYREAELNQPRGQHGEQFEEGAVGPAKRH
jgi:hypothetical protein